MERTNFVKNFVLCFMLVWTGSFGLYEDQAGKFDWRQKYVGGMEHVAFDQCGQNVCKRFIVGTDQKVLASLSMKTGEIVWRQLMEKSQVGRIDDLIVVDGNIIVVLGGGVFIRCFSASLGTLNWELEKEKEASNQRASLRVVDSDDEKLIIVLAANTLYGVDVRGRQQWTKALANSDTVNYKFLHARGETLTVIGVSAKSHVTIVKMTQDGTLLSQSTVPAAWISEDTGCETTGDYLVCTDTPSGILHYLSLNKPEVFMSALLQDFGVMCTEPSVISSVSDNPQGELAVRCQSQNVAMLRITDNGMQLLKDLPGVNTVQVVRYGDSRTFVTLGRNKAECELRGYDLESGLELPELTYTVPLPAHHGLPLEIYGLIKKKEATPTIRLLILSEDDSIVLFHHTPSPTSHGKLLWVREEALSKIVNVDMVDLPVSPILAKMEDEFGTGSGISASDIFEMFVRRITTQLSQFQTFVQQLKSKLRFTKHHHHADVDVNVYDDVEEDEDYLFRDDFNLKKIIILTTDVGKIYGLYSQTGRILWRHLLSDIQPFESAGKKMLPIYMQRTTAHFPHDPQCMILGKHKKSGLGLMYLFHPVSGHPLDDTPPGGQQLNYRIVQSLMTNQMDDHALHPVVILDADYKYHVYPSGCTDMVKNMASSLFVFTSDTNKAQLSGYSMSENSDQELIAKPLWNLNLGGEGQTITNIVTKRSNEHVHSQGIVLADRSVLYKYLNPNLVVVTTEGLDTAQKGFLNVYLVDAVSGHMVFYCNHKKVKGPIHFVHSENWIVYYLWNQRHRRSEISVLELYEGKKQSNATAFSSLYPPPLPMVLRQSYIFSAHVNTMGVTITEKGITNKHVLLALESGGILEMPKALLDPRRPEVPTQEHREEGIIPYIPELPRQNELVINYNKSVQNVRGIHTAPAGLESHSMVLAYGLDLYYTRVMPSKMFDVLKEDFDYFFIGSVTLGMILVSLITKKLASRKALNRAWK